jgi:hypothetical protein
MIRLYRSEILGMMAILMVAYVAGFYLVVLGFRAESNDLRLLALRIDDWLYRPVITATEKDSVIRQLGYHRVKWLCAGYETRCSTQE